MATYFGMVSMMDHYIGKILDKLEELDLVKNTVNVLQVEAMAQTAGLLVLSTVEEPERYSTYFMKIDNVKFRQKVVPGDTLIFHVSFMTELRRGCANMKGYAFVGDKVVSEAEFMAQIIKNK